MKIEGWSLIAGTAAQPSGKTFVGINPANGSALPGEFHIATSSEVAKATASAATAFATFSKCSGVRRAELLQRIAALLEVHAAEIVACGQLETALPQPRLQGELARTCFQLRSYGEAAATGLCAGARIDHADPKRQPQPKPDLRSMLIPLGPVAVFGASNFPLAYSVAGGDTASALAAGCPVVFKAHPAHPGTSELVGKLVTQAVKEIGAPPGTFSLLFDAGHEVGTALVKDPHIKAVGFTGSHRGGRALADLAAARPEPIPVYAEMGSINPIFIMSSALAQRAEEIAVGLHASVTLGVGQFCTNPGLVFAQNGTGTQAFVGKLQNLMSATPAGTMLTSGISQSYRKGVQKFSQTPGVQLLTPATVSETHACHGIAALLVTDAKTFRDNRHLTDEIFGPATLVVTCDDVQQMSMLAQSLEGQLTASLHATSEDLAQHHELLDVLTKRSGRVVFNGFPTGVEVAHAMTHGGPYPATSDGRSTSVGSRAIERFLRPVSYQNLPDAALPAELREDNPLKILRLVDGKFTV